MPERVMRALCALARWRLLTVDLLHETAFADTSIKNAEAAVAEAVRRRLVYSNPCGGKRVYSLTAKGAAAVGLEGSVFRRPPNVQAVFDRLPLNQFAVSSGKKILTPAEIREDFPLHFAVGACRSRYYMDGDRMMLLIPCVRASIAATIHKARAAIELRRKMSPVIKQLIYARGFGISIVTVFEPKAERILEALKQDKFLHEVYVVEMAGLLFLDGAKS